MKFWTGKSEVSEKEAKEPVEDRKREGFEIREQKSREAYEREKPFGNFENVGEEEKSYVALADNFKMLQERYEEDYYSKGTKKEEWCSLQKQNSELIEELMAQKEAVIEAEKEKHALLKEYVVSHEMTRYSSSQDVNYQYLNEEYKKLSEDISRLNYLIVKLDENNISISEITGETYESVQNKKIEKDKYMEYDISSDNLGHWNEISEEVDVLENLKECNPHYEEGEEWQVNCQRCVPTFEMRCRGYDVTAMPKENAGDEISYHPFSVWENPKVEECAGDGETDIRAKMKEWGDGARAQVVVIWENTSSGHTFFAEQVGEETHFYDPQTGEADVAYYFRMAENDSTQVCRVDELKPSEKILDCCKGVKHDNI